jgi:hypothetical protein
MTRNEAIIAITAVFKAQHEDAIRRAQARLNGTAVVVSKLTDADHEHAAIEAIDSAIYDAACMSIMARA